MKKHLHHLLIIVCLTTAVLGFNLFKAQAEDTHKDEAIHYKNLSMFQILAAPEKYHQQYVALNGYMVYRDGEHAFYAYKEDYAFSNFKNGFWVDIPDEEMTAHSLFELKKTSAIIRGRFLANQLGPHNSWSGTITDVKAVYVAHSDEPHSHGGVGHTHNDGNKSHDH